MHNWFQKIALFSSNAVGSPTAFLLAFASVLVWAALGPLMGFSDTWQLIINSTSSIITFLVVFLIQYAQNRDTHAIRLKLDELLRATEGAQASMVDLDRLSDDEIERLEGEFKAWRQRQAGNEHPSVPDTARRRA
jgi:low affinity Fe/Cu permease